MERLRTLQSFGLLEMINLHDCGGISESIIPHGMNARFGPPVDLPSLRRKPTDSRSVANLAGPGGIGSICVLPCAPDPSEPDDDQLTNYALRFVQDEAPCPRCLFEYHEDGKPDAAVHRTKWSRLFQQGGKTREWFFMTVGAPDGKPTDPMPHETNIFGCDYMLRAVVYKKAGGHHFVCQVSLRGHWYKYNDMYEGGKLMCGPGFDENWCAGSEYMLMYVRKDIVASPSNTAKLPSSSERVRGFSGTSGGGKPEAGEPTRSSTPPVEEPTLPAANTRQVLRAASA